MSFVPQHCGPSGAIASGKDSVLASDSVTIPEKSPVDLGIAAALFAGSCIYLFPFYNYTTLFCDEGVVFQGAQRILEGQVLYRDFFTWLTPGSYYLMALLFRVFGSSILVGHAALVIYGGLFAALTYLVARRVCSRWTASTAAFLVTVACLPYYFMALHNWDSTLWAYLALYFAVRSLESRRWTWPALIGSFAAFTCLCEQSRGGGLVLGMGLGFVLIAWGRNRRISLNSPFLAALVAGFMWPFVATFAYFAMHHSLPQMLSDWFWPVTHYSAGNRAFYGQAEFAMSDVHALLAGSLVVGLTAVFALAPYAIIPALPILAVGVLTFGFHRLWQSHEAQEISSYYVLVSATLVGLLTSTLATGRPDLIHIMVQAPLFFLILAWALGGRGLRPPLIHTLQTPARFVIVTSFVVFGLALLWAPLNAHYTLRTRRGLLKAAGPDAVLEDLLMHVRPGARVFVYPRQPLYYYLAATRNPTRFEFLSPGVYTREQYDETLRDVEADRTPIVLFEPGFIQRLPTSRSSMPLNVLAAPDLGAEFILAHYKNCKSLNSELQSAKFLFMVRKDLSCEGPF